MPSRPFDRLKIICNLIPVITTIILTAVMCQGCFTGIEGTKKITISREEKKLLQPTAEQLLMKDIKGVNIAEWLPGKRFVVADERIDRVLLPSTGSTTPMITKGDTLIYSELLSTTGFDGNEEYHIIFTKSQCSTSPISPEERLDYSTRLSGLNRLQEIVSDRLPMLIDLDMVRQTDALLKGKKVFLLSPNWLDSLGNRKAGVKYIEAVIERVRPGTQIHPMIVDFSLQSSGEKGSYFMNFDTGERSARVFASLFALDNPHKLYSSIPAETWQNICEGSVSTGMNKNECRLALGSPDDVTATRDYSSTIDIWRYADGSVLFFRDGLLTEYKVGTEQNK